MLNVEPHLVVLVPAHTPLPIAIPSAQAQESVPNTVAQLAHAIELVPIIVALSIPAEQVLESYPANVFLIPVVKHRPAYAPIPTLQPPVVKFFNA